MAGKKTRVSILERVPKGTNPLSYAYQLTKKASRLGFDWPDITEVFKKLDEEIKELREAVALKNRKRVREEIGDLFFVLANIARFLRIDPEEALSRTLEKFTLRFHHIEASLRKQGKSFRQANLFEMDQLWEEAKRKEKRSAF
jgi:tetrapyrrole methylase family protein/MazG family protein